MPLNKVRLQSGSAIVEVIDNPQENAVLLTVSKERYDEDAVQIALDRNIAKALGHTLTGTPNPEIANLRRLCNEVIDRINHGEGPMTPGFNTINTILKACDRVFAAADAG